MSVVPEPRDPEYLVADEVAALLRRSTKTIYRLVKAEPSMPVLKLGGSVLFPRERLLRWLRDREQGAPRMRHQLRSVANGAPPQEPPRA